MEASWLFRVRDSPGVAEQAVSKRVWHKSKGLDSDPSTHL